MKNSSEVESWRMKEACESCAFREGSETFDRQPYNRFRGHICALSGMPLYCHHGFNWRKPIADKLGLSVDTDGNAQRIQICQGWRSEVVKQISTKTPNRIIRRGLGQYCLELLESAVRETGPEEKAELWEEMRSAFKMLLKA